MRPSLLLAAALAGAAAPALALADAAAATAPPPAPSETDVRCIVVSFLLSQNDDPHVQSLGRAGLFYFSGRLQGRGDTTDLAGRVADTYGRMTADDVKAQIPICTGLFTVATQSLQDMSATLQQRLGPPTTSTPPPPPPATPH